MGVDVHGKAPRSTAGKYFSTNWAGWSSLVEMSFRVAPGICMQLDRKYWFINDGYGLDDAGARALADALERAIDSDFVRYANALSGQESAAERKRLLGMTTVNGRSLADVSPHLIPDGKPWFIDSLRAFAAFLRDSGGFAIW
jgi:hypothetical protein